MYHQGRHYSRSESLASDISDVTSRATTLSDSSDVGHRLRPLEVKLFDSVDRVPAQHQQQPEKFIDPFRGAPQTNTEQ